MRSVAVLLLILVACGAAGYLLLADEAAPPQESYASHEPIEQEAQAAPSSADDVDQDEALDDTPIEGENPLELTPFDPETEDVNDSVVSKVRRRILVSIVNVDGTPMKGVRVRLRSSRRKSFRRSGWDKVIDGELLTNSKGQILGSVPVARYICAGAHAGESYGRSVLRLKQAPTTIDEEPPPFEMEVKLHPIRRVRVKVKNHRGEGVYPGLKVELCGQSLKGKRTGATRPVTTNEDSLAAFELTTEDKAVWSSPLVRARFKQASGKWVWSEPRNLLEDTELILALPPSIDLVATLNPGDEDLPNRVDIQWWLPGKEGKFRRERTSTKKGQIRLRGLPLGQKIFLRLTGDKREPADFQLDLPPGPVVIEKSFDLGPRTAQIRATIVTRSGEAITGKQLHWKAAYPPNPQDLDFYDNAPLSAKVWRSRPRTSSSGLLKATLRSGMPCTLTLHLNGYKSAAIGSVQVSAPLPGETIDLGKVTVDGIYLLAKGEVVKSDGKPMSRTSVLLKQRQPRSTDPSRPPSYRVRTLSRTTSDSGGKFAIFGDIRSAGTLSLSAARSGFRSIAEPIVRGESNARITLVRLGSIRGRMRLATGIKGLQKSIRFTHENPSEPAVRPGINRSGIFYARKLMPGSWTAEVTLGRQVTRRIPGIYIAEGEHSKPPALKDLVVGQDIAVGSVQVILESGEPVKGARVKIYESGDTAMDLPTVRTGERGEANCMFRPGLATKMSVRTPWMSKTIHNPQLPIVVKLSGKRYSEYLTRLAKAREADSRRPHITAHFSPALPSISGVREYELHCQRVRSPSEPPGPQKQRNFRLRKSTKEYSRIRLDPGTWNISLRIRQSRRLSRSRWKKIELGSHRITAAKYQVLPTFHVSAAMVREKL